MNKNLNLTLAFAAGSVGALLTRYVVPMPAFAQTQQSVVQEIHAKSFILIDAQDRTLAKLTYVPDVAQPFPGPPRGRVVLQDPTGREIWSAGGNSFRPLLARGEPDALSSWPMPKLWRRETPRSMTGASVLNNRCSWPRDCTTSGMLTAMVFGANPNLVSCVNRMCCEVQDISLYRSLAPLSASARSYAAPEFLCAAAPVSRYRR